MFLRTNRFSDNFFQSFRSAKNEISVDNKFDVLQIMDIFENGVDMAKPK
jgi:hypothetical protein